jgi:hypothetical protein
MTIKKILWLALFSTQFLFLGLSLSTTPFTGISLNDPIDPIHVVLMISGFFILLLSVILPRTLKTINVPANTTESPEVIVDRTKFILSLALNESASINAFILVFIFKNWTFGAILFTASIIAFLLKFPKEEKNLEKNPTGLDA